MVALWISNLSFLIPARAITVIMQKHKKRKYDILVLLLNWFGDGMCI